VYTACLSVAVFDAKISISETTADRGSVTIGSLQESGRAESTDDVT